MAGCIAVVDKLRDHRLRHFYEARYDYRNNLIDWDYTVSFNTWLAHIYLAWPEDCELLCMCR